MNATKSHQMSMCSPYMYGSVSSHFVWLHESFFGPTKRSSTESHEVTLARPIKNQKSVSLVSKRHERINFRSSTRRDPARQKRNEPQYPDHYTERRRVAGTYFEEQAAKCNLQYNEAAPQALPNSGSRATSFFQYRVQVEPR